ncbi:hypochlorite stress DNA-binding transcriptional regulator HypT [Edwardsiella tarda]|uniref:hypochlorite stress DNA-binding transcriptional regulator HypT n=1 Tax=Edwardsiella tarda TaxID=636 RepID=UPI00351C427E
MERGGDGQAHNIETKWLYDFLMLEACRNFSQAALRRNVSQSAFSRRIQSLEQACGVVLFDRSVSPLPLTEQGKIFHSQVRNLLQQLESNLAELRSGGDPAQQRITIAAAHSLSLGLLPSLVKTLPAQFSYTVEAIDVDRAVDTLREGKSDFIFSYHDDNLLQTPFAHIHLFSSQLFPVCAADAYGAPLYRLDQADAPLLNYNANSYMGRQVNRLLARHPALTFRTVFVSSMSELLKQVALDGSGIAWLPGYGIRQELAQGRLVALDEHDLLIPIDAYAYRLDTRMSQSVERFWQALRQQFTPQEE